jgi:hypothetical protein
VSNLDEIEEAVGQAQHSLASIVLYVRLLTNNPEAVRVFADNRGLLESAYLELGVALSRVPKNKLNVIDLAPFLHRQAAE